MLHQRFPEMAQAKQDYTQSEENFRSANKKIHADEVKKFSKVVYDLANETEPHPARVNAQYSKKKTPEFKSQNSLSPTVARSVKDRYVIRSHHN